MEGDRSGGEVAGQKTSPPLNRRPAPNSNPRHLDRSGGQLYRPSRSGETPVFRSAVSPSHRLDAILRSAAASCALTTGDTFGGANFQFSSYFFSASSLLFFICQDILSRSSQGMVQLLFFELRD
jgi:hypothetical protein